MRCLALVLVCCVFIGPLEAISERDELKGEFSMLSYIGLCIL